MIGIVALMAWNSTEFFYALLKHIFSSLCENRQDHALSKLKESYVIKYMLI